MSSLKTCFNKSVQTFIVITFLLLNTTVLSKTIPASIKKQEFRLIKNSLYETGSRLFDDYRWEEKYRNDLIKFYKKVIITKGISDKNLSTIYKEMIRLGYFNYRRKIIELSNMDRKNRIKKIALGYYQFHKNRNAKWQNVVDVGETIYSDSFHSYENPNYTPDLVLDRDFNTAWRINPLNGKRNSTLFFEERIEKNNLIKILFKSSPVSKHKKYWRPKKIRLSTISGRTGEVILTRIFAIKDLNKFQTLDLKLNVVDKIKSYKWSSVVNEYFILKFEILDYYKGEIPYCYISEVNIIPVID